MVKEETQVKELTSEQISKLIVEGMQEKKASEIVVLDLKDIKHAIADYFVICCGNSDTQIDAISDSVEEILKKRIHQTPWKTEGKQNKEWVLLDYVDVVAHIFNKEKRRFYGLEELWGDAKFTKIES